MILFFLTITSSKLITFKDGVLMEDETFALFYGIKDEILNLFLKMSMIFENRTRDH